MKRVRVFGWLMLLSSGVALFFWFNEWIYALPIGYLRNSGFANVCFTQLYYLELQTSIIHIFLAGIIFFICGLWAHQVRNAGAMRISQTPDRQAAKGDLPSR